MQTIGRNYTDFLHFKGQSGIDIAYGIPLNNEIRDYVSYFGATFLNQNITHVYFNTMSGRYYYMKGVDSNDNLVPFSLEILDNFGLVQLTIRFFNQSTISRITFDPNTRIPTIVNNYIYDGIKLIDSITYDSAQHRGILYLNYLPGQDFGYEKSIRYAFLKDYVAFPYNITRSSVLISNIKPTQILNKQQFYNTNVATYNIPCYGLQNYLPNICGRTDTGGMGGSYNFQLNRTNGINYSGFTDYDAMYGNALPYRPQVLFNNFGETFTSSKAISSAHPLTITVGTNYISINGTQYELTSKDRIIGYYRQPSSTITRKGKWRFYTAPQGPSGGEYDRIVIGEVVDDSVFENLIAQYIITPNTVQIGELTHGLRTITLNSNTDVYSQYPVLTGTGADANIFASIILTYEPPEVGNQSEITSGNAGDIVSMYNYLYSGTGHTEKDITKNGIICNGHSVKLSEAIEYIPSSNEPPTIYGFSEFNNGYQGAYNTIIFQNMFAGGSQVYLSQFLTTIGVVKHGCYGDQVSKGGELDDHDFTGKEYHNSGGGKTFDYKAYSNWWYFAAYTTYPQFFILCSGATFNNKNDETNCVEPYLDNIDLDQPALAIVLGKYNE